VPTANGFAALAASIASIVIALVLFYTITNREKKHQSNNRDDH
jgi:peptidoglycan biosynthesis protein MviN/MurJ (putative lipid II flippase)